MPIKKKSPAAVPVKKYTDEQQPYKCPKCKGIFVYPQVRLVISMQAIISLFDHTSWSHIGIEYEKIPTICHALNQTARHLWQSIDPEDRREIIDDAEMFDFRISRMDCPHCMYVLSNIPWNISPDVNRITGELILNKRDVKEKILEIIKKYMVKKKR